jgi:putative aldouronate transport system substrate-binding protein
MALLIAAGMLASCQSVAPTATTTAATTAATTTATKATTTPEPTAEIPSYLKDTSPITFDWYVDASWYTRAKWGVDATSKYITKKTGVTINIVLPTGNEAEKKNLMIATGEVPDFISMGHWETARKQMVEAKLVYTLNELADKHATDFWDVTTPSTVGWFTEADGKIYGYPCCNWPIERIDLPYNQNYLLSYIGFSVRKGVYESIGSPDMTTPEGFLAAIAAAKEKNPELIPFSFGAEFTDKGNVAIDDQLIQLLSIPRVDANNKLVNPLLNPEFIAWLKTFRKANELGLLPKEIFIDKFPQIEEAFKAGRVFSSMYAINSLPNKINGPLFDQDPNSIYIQIEGPQNSKREKAQFTVGGLSGWLWTAISAKNRNPERAIKFMQYWLSEEGQGDFFLGDPAVTRTEDGKAIKQEIYDLRAKDEEGFCKTYGNMDNYFMLIDPSIKNQWEAPVRKPFEQQPYDFQKGRMKDTTEFSGLDPATDSLAGIELTKSRTKWGTLLPKMLLASSDAEFDALLAEYKAVDDAARLVYLPEMQAVYDANCAKLGK